MYSRYPNYRFSGGVRVPNNYSGNAFRQREAPTEDTERPPEELPREEENRERTAAEEREADLKEERREKQLPIVSYPSKEEHSLPRLSFGKSLLSDIGSEELLLLALIFILSSSEDRDDITLFLILLLFVS